ncbi:MAG: hypothetical protein IV090_03955 [Candidatus Sericytochromatia bacterium]|nr:hypothetical protein [Candidatus Sericytochromatia bacterium]
MMRLLSPSLFKLLPGLALASTLWVSPVLASVENALDPIPKDPSFVATVQTELEPWGYFVQRFLELGQSDQLKELTATLEKKGLDLTSDLLPIFGSHISVAAYGDGQSENKKIEVLFSVDLSSPAAAQALLDKLQKINDPDFSVKTESHDGRTLLTVSEHKNQKPEMIVGLVVSGSNLLISAAPDTAILKRALAAQGSRSGNVLSQAGFHKTFQRFKTEPVWGWANEGLDNQFRQALGQMSGENPFQQGAALQALWAGTGFSARPSQQGLSMQFYTPLAQNIPAEWQAFYAQWAAPASPPLKGLLDALPAKPMFVMGGQKLNRYADLGFYPEGPSQASQDMKKMMTTLASTWKELLPAVDAGLDLKKDLLPHLDGRYGLTMDVNSEGVPQVLAYLGVQPESQAKLGLLLRNKFKLDPALFDEFTGASTKAKTSSVKANMHTLQTLVETYGVDWGGMYPENMARLEKVAKTGSYPYWKEIINPVNQQTGTGLKKALLDYKTYKNFRPHTSFAGMVFYEPLGKGEYSQDCKCKHYAAYRIYGYSPEGELWMMQGGDDNLSMAKVAEKLPSTQVTSTKPIVFASQPIAYQNQQIYLLQLPKQMQTSEAEVFQPGFVQLGDFWVLGSHLSLLKQAVDQASAKEHFAQNPLYTRLQQKLKEPNSDFLLYLDAEKLRDFIAKLGENDNDLPEMMNIIAPFQGFLMQWNQQVDAVSGQIEIPIEMDKVDFKSLQKMLSEPFNGSAVGRSKLSSVKANMHTLQTIVETYGVDNGGTYASDLDILLQAAQNNAYGSYWKDFANPFTSQRGIGLRGAIMAFKDYSPSPDFAGMVLYKPGEGKEPTTYWIYGVDQNGELISDQEQPYVLTNS